MTEPLTVKQWAVIRLIDQGLSRSQIAGELDLTETNVRETIRRLCERFGVLQHQLPFVVDGCRVMVDGPGGRE
jgi:DNA-binding NarL/FixJ family response regulator